MWRKAFSIGSCAKQSVLHATNMLILLIRLADSTCALRSGERAEGSAAAWSLRCHSEVRASRVVAAALDSLIQCELASLANSA